MHVDRAVLDESSQLHCKQLSQARAATFAHVRCLDSPERVWSTACYTAQRQKLSGKNGTSLKMNEIGRREYSCCCSYLYFPLARAVGCIKMEKHKFTDEIAQSKHQKPKLTSQS